MKSSSLLAAILIAAAAGPAWAQFANSPPAAFLAAPSSTMGVIAGNSLTLASMANGFVVSGQLVITIPAGPVSGVLAQWSVVRRVDTTFSGSGLQTQTILSGFSSPPPGTFGTTTGSVNTTYTFAFGSGPTVGGSTSTVPMTLVNGIDTPAWNNLSATSSPFVWTAGLFTSATMLQTFTLLGNYTGGPGGNWIVDVPVTSITAVPEPASQALILAGFIAVLALSRALRCGTVRTGA